MSIAKGIPSYDNASIPSLNATFQGIDGARCGRMPIPIVIMGAVLIICFVLLYKTATAATVRVGATERCACLGHRHGKIPARVRDLRMLAALAASSHARHSGHSTGDGYETNAIAMVVIGGTALRRPWQALGNHRRHPAAPVPDDGP
jgi:ribose/xylose/arabinose/galactoside ABC-type transport system permease subunit